MFSVCNSVIYWNWVLTNRKKSESMKLKKTEMVLFSFLQYFITINTVQYLGESSIVSQHKRSWLINRDVFCDNKKAQLNSAGWGKNNRERVQSQNQNECSNEHLAWWLDAEGYLERWILTVHFEVLGRTHSSVRRKAASCEDKNS